MLCSWSVFKSSSNLRFTVHRSVVRSRCFRNVQCTSEKRLSHFALFTAYQRIFFVLSVSRILQAFEQPFFGEKTFKFKQFCSRLLGNSPIVTGGSCGLSSPKKTSIPQNVIWNAKSRWIFIHQRSVLSCNLRIKHYLPLLPRFIAWPRTRLWFNKHLEAG